MIYDIIYSARLALRIVKWWQGGAEEQPAVDSSAWDPRCLLTTNLTTTLISTTITSTGRPKKNAPMFPILEGK